MYTWHVRYINFIGSTTFSVGSEQRSKTVTLYGDVMMLDLVQVKHFLGYAMRGHLTQKCT
jgi:hypothetical protein